MSDYQIPEDLLPRYNTFHGWQERINDSTRTSPVSPVLKQLTDDGLILIERIAKAEHDLAVAQEALRLACQDAWPKNPHWSEIYLKRAASNINVMRQYTEEAAQ